MFLPPSIVVKYHPSIRWQNVYCTHRLDFLSKLLTHEDLKIQSLFSESPQQKRNS